MNIDFMGRFVRIQSGYLVTLLLPGDFLELMVWAKEHEIEIAAKANELEREQERKVHLLAPPQPPYMLGEEEQI